MKLHFLDTIYVCTALFIGILLLSVSASLFAEETVDNPFATTPTPLQSTTRNVLNLKTSPKQITPKAVVVNAVNTTQNITSGTGIPNTTPQALSQISVNAFNDTPSSGPINIQPKVLVLYDYPQQAFKKLGLAYAIMLRNLIGHFTTDIILTPIGQYTDGSVADFDAIFYLGSYYDNPNISQSFLTDIATTNNTVVWFKYNLWKAAWFTTEFIPNTGINWKQLRGFNAPPSVKNPNPGFFNAVHYKGKVFEKYYDFNPATLAFSADPDIGEILLVDPNKATKIVDIENLATKETAPYITRSGKFWYIADIPFSFIGPRDRYLVMADMLHEILNIDHPERHRALVRLEDVGAKVNPNYLRTLTDYLVGKKIPFSIGVMPIYKDPFGAYTGGIPEEIKFNDAKTLLSALDYAVQRGAAIIHHGFTHQYDGAINPNSGVTGDDFEFWDVVNNTRLPNDSIAWWAARIDAGYNDLISHGYMPVAWETPHYQSSPYGYLAVAGHFNTRYERSMYYTANEPNLHLATTDPERDFSVGQFYPYVILADHYNQRVIPENLGNIEYDIRNIDPTSNIEYTWKDLLINAEYSLTIRDGYASFFFHPFWLGTFAGTNIDGLTDFKNIIQGITDLGYQWTPVSTLVK